jgi:uncharacterized membrane protein
VDHVIFAATFLAALGTGLLAGNFFAFSAFLLKALAGLSPERGIVAMQAIARTIKTPVFLLVFFGTAALCAILACVALLHWRTPGAGYLLAGALLFLLGAFPITMMRHVPLNAALIAQTPDANNARAFWTRFRSEWTLWNHLRALTALLACASLMLALVRAS